MSFFFRFTRVCFIFAHNAQGCYHGAADGLSGRFSLPGGGEAERCNFTETTELLREACRSLNGVRWLHERSISTRQLLPYSMLGPGSFLCSGGKLLRSYSNGATRLQS
jgi:hypothetical protein